MLTQVCGLWKTELKFKIATPTPTQPTESFVSLAVSALTLFSTNSQHSGAFGIERSAERGNLKRQDDREHESTGDRKLIKC